MTDAQAGEASGITGLVLIGLPFIPFVTVAISELLLWLYRRAVVRAMTDRASPGAVATVAASPRAVTVTQPDVELVVQTADAGGSAGTSGGALYARFQRATTGTTVIYVLAGVVYAGLMALAMGVQSRTLSFASWLVYTVGYAWPAVLTAILIMGWRGRRRRTAVISAYLVVFLLGTLATTLPLTGDYLLGILAANVAATIVGLIVRARRIHAVAPLVGAVVTIVGAALLFAFAVAAGWNEPPPGQGPAPEMGASEAFLFLGILLALLTAGPVAAWFALRAVAAQYGRKRTSEQSIGMTALWLTFAGIQSTTFAFVNERWIAAGGVAFLVFYAIVAAGFRVLRGRGANDEQGPRLLVLRVFALGRKSRNLFDRFTTHWRHVGSVQLIAGPDLASSTVEPHEFLDFLRRRLGHRYLDSAESIDRALSQLDAVPDPDGRYRISDFICRDHAWRTVFHRLAAASDVVLMDLRGFSPANSGCTYEVGELLNVVPSDRITIVVDRFTDEAFLERTLADARARLAEGSPNLTATRLQLRAFRETDRQSLDPDRLFQLLCDRTLSTAERTPVAQAV
jgi:hypothetical protein